MAGSPDQLTGELDREAQPSIVRIEVEIDKGSPVQR
jgi:hypothetical protein